MKNKKTTRTATKAVKNLKPKVDQVKGGAGRSGTIDLAYARKNG